MQTPERLAPIVFLQRNPQIFTRSEIRLCTTSQQVSSGSAAQLASGLRGTFGGFRIWKRDGSPWWVSISPYVSNNFCFIYFQAQLSITKRPKPLCLSCELHYFTKIRLPSLFCLCFCYWIFLRPILLLWLLFSFYLHLFSMYSPIHLLFTFGKLFWGASPRNGMYVNYFIQF